MTWQDDYYLGSSDYPVTGADDDVDPVRGPAWFSPHRDELDPEFAAAADEDDEGAA